MSEQQTAPTVEARPPCTQCGNSMEGQHHKRTVCETCKPPVKHGKKRTPKQDAAPQEPVTRGKRPAAGAIKIKVAPLPPPDEEGEQSEYWLGTLPTCPIQNVVVGGICFPLFTGIPSLDDKGRILDGQIMRGGTAHLTEKQVDFVVQAISTKVLRFTGRERETYIPPLGSEKEPRKIKRRTATTVSRDENYKQAPGDEPLAAHLYMIRTDAMDFHGRDVEPESMLEE